MNYISIILIQLYFDPTASEEIETVIGIEEVDLGIERAPRRKSHPKSVGRKEKHRERGRSCCHKQVRSEKKIKMKPY
jgi:hypothetical protein